MENWYVKNLGDAMLACDEQDRIEACFRSAREAEGCSDKVAAFARHESDGRLHCEVKLYFSPASVDIAKALGAMCCAQPSVHGLALLVGSEAAWGVLFAEDEQ
ncbi:hypothetical protein [Pontibacterium sp.]|uniref:hypothetical protein n=1 Tax=Pontibacterium sp. TaxID=2036026 RepID=UPI00351582E8